MKKPTITSRTAFLLVAMTTTVLIMVPLITGAAPSAAPPGGLITPTFSGMKINNGTSFNLNVSSNGDISNVSTDYVRVNDSNGFEVANGSGDAVLRVEATGTLSNPSTTPDAPRPPKNNPLNIADSITTTGSLSAAGNITAGNLWAGNMVNADNVAIDNIYARNLLGGSTINVAAGLALDGKLTARDGVGVIRSYSATSASIANGATGTISRGCDAGVLISCGFNANNNWYVFDTYRSVNPFATPPVRCYASARNSTGAAGTFSVVTVCLDAAS